MFETPILILAFNRPRLLTKVIERLREIKPRFLFFAIDGPRLSHPLDVALVASTQSSVSLVDWPCTIQTLFHDRNLGCGRAVATGLAWFFNHVEQGIVLEDDVLPRSEFFPYCEELLDRYCDDSRVFAISGSNFAPQNELPTVGSYRFSYFTNVWGWATWRRSWEQYQYDIRNWRRRLPYKQRLDRTGGHLADFAFWSIMFYRVSRGKPDTWDFQLNLAQMAVGGLTATSNFNLVDNIGIGASATHTKGETTLVTPSQRLEFPLQHPDVGQDLRADRWCMREIRRDIIRRKLMRICRKSNHS